MIRASSKASSRRLLLLGSSALVLGATWPISRAKATLTVAKDRPNWRFCNKCNVMFYSVAENSSCAAGGRHTPQGYEFRLPFGGQETGNAQSRWFCCRNCSAMVFNGYQQKGRCPANRGDTRDRGHEADTTFRYVLPHDVQGTPTAQTDWRFCNKCFSMFYDGYPAKGHCAAGGGHLSQGYNFVLPHVS